MTGAVEDHWDGRIERREANLATLDLRLETLHKDVGDVKIVLRDLTQAITKLALIEERQGQTSQQVNRLFTVLEKFEARVSAMEKKIPLTDRTNVWVERFFSAVVGMALVLIARSAGFL